MSGTKEIWPFETGILDLPADWQSLEVSELSSIRGIWKDQRDRLKGTEQLRQFTEQLNREWAIETGVLENLYEIDRGVTQTLIEHGFRAAFLEFGSTNKPPDYVIQLLKDQQDALEGLFQFVTQQRCLSTSYIKELHSALLRHQNYVDNVSPDGQPVKVPLIRGDWKKQPNHVTRDGVTYCYCPPEQVASEMDHLIALHVEHEANGVPSEVEAAWLHHRFTQIHPFQDGNGRVVRAIASLIFIQKNLFPLVVTRDEKVDYLNALEAADDGDLAPLVNLFAKLQERQFRKATNIAEIYLGDKPTVEQALEGLNAAIRRKKEAEEQERQLQNVREYATRLEDTTIRRLSELRIQLQAPLRQLHPAPQIDIDSDTIPYDPDAGKILEIVIKSLDDTNTNAYLCFVRLTIWWGKVTGFVFAFHSVGRTFTGTLGCTPRFVFVERQDDGDNTDLRTTVIRLTDEPFLFFYDEILDNIEKRFKPWLEAVLAKAVTELGNHL